MEQETFYLTKEDIRKLSTNKTYLVFTADMVRAFGLSYIEGWPEMLSKIPVTQKQVDNAIFFRNKFIEKKYRYKANDENQLNLF